MFHRIIIAVAPSPAEQEEGDPRAEEAAKERFRRTVALMVERAALRYQLRQRREED